MEGNRGVDYVYAFSECSGRNWFDEPKNSSASPIASYTIYFYLAIVLLPPLATFFIYVRRHPVGQRKPLVVLLVFASVMICFYLTLLSPAFYNDIQCQVRERTGLMVRLDCQCEYAPSGSTILEPCAAEQWWPIPLMRLAQER